MPNLQDIIYKLQDSGITKRADGVKLFKATFESQDAMVIFEQYAQQSSHGVLKIQTVCSTVLQALYGCIETERSLLRKSPSKATTSTRLENAASALRLFTEKITPLLKISIFTKLLDKLCQFSIRDDTSLLPETALSCAKALRRLVQNTACLDRITVDPWLQVVEFAFNIILGDPVSHSLLDDNGDDKKSEPLDQFYASDAADSSSEEEPPVKRRKTSTQPGKSVKSGSARRSKSSTPKFQGKIKVISYDTRVRVELMGFLADLFQACHWPLLDQGLRALPEAVMARLHRILSTHDVDSSLHSDYISCLHTVLSVLALNKRAEVESFACKAWKPLTALWRSKDKRLKEGLTSIFRILFPLGEAARSDALRRVWVNGLSELWLILDKEYDTHRQPLNLEIFRLEILPFHRESNQPASFVANTFSLAAGADATQALSWAMIELQADCTKQMYRLSESFDPADSLTLPKGAKRAKVTDPFSSILSSISSGTARIYHLQIILFIVDRHWSTLHDDLRRKILGEMVKLVSVDHSETQSWVYLILAAITCASSQSPDSSASRLQSDSTVWDSIWTHSIRRVNVPALSRAACHSANAILLCASKKDRGSHRLSMSANRILIEIETVGKDLEVQGPAAPCDSVCMFLSECIRIAGQDVRLFRMQFNDQAMQWLTYSWRVNKLDVAQGLSLPFLIKDIILLLGTICAFEKVPSLIHPPGLPKCRIVEALKEHHSSSVIRDFILSAKLPSSNPEDSHTAHSEPLLTSRPTDFDLLPPSDTVSRALTFVQQIVERLIEDCGSRRTTNSTLDGDQDILMGDYASSSGSVEFKPTVDQAVNVLNLVTLSLTFNALVNLNGIRSNQRISQCASQLLSLFISPSIKKWTAPEKLQVLWALCPLVVDGSEDSVTPWEPLMQPKVGTGIRRNVLRKLGKKALPTQHHTLVNLQRLIWSSSEMQDCSGNIFDNVKQFLVDLHPTTSAQADHDDEFEPVRISQASTSSGTDWHTYAELSRISFNFLTTVPFFQSASGESVTSSELRDILIDEGRPLEFFCIFAPFFSDAIRRNVLRLSTQALYPILQKFSKALGNPQYSYSGPFYVNVLHFIQSTIDLWVDLPVDDDFWANVDQLLQHISSQVKNDKIHQWEARDALARLMDSYLDKCPRYPHFFGDERIFEDKGVPGPIRILVDRMSDDDIRVRFRVAPSNARIFSVFQAHPFQGNTVKTIDDLYLKWSQHAPSEVLGPSRFEFMLTRVLTLANVVIASSVIRRGPFWNLLETYLFSKKDGQIIDSKYMEVVLLDVAYKLGLPGPSLLVNAFATQLAFTFRHRGYSIFDFPPRLLGYKDNIHLAGGTFARLTPSNVAAEGTPSQIKSGRSSFETHCRYVKKSPSEGILECLGDIVGLQVMASIADHLGGGSVDLEVVLRETTSYILDKAFENALKANFPFIVAAILRGLGDHDCSRNGPILEVLQSPPIPTLASSVFLDLVAFRKPDDAETYEPIRPAYPVVVILNSILWIKQRVPSHDIQAASYHIFRTIFYEIQSAIDVNEKIRLLNALCLWIALHHDEIAQVTLLLTLLQGAVSLLAQEDLLHASQSILDYVLKAYGESDATSQDNSFPDILVRLSCVAHDYSDRYGDEIMTWVDNRVFALSKVSALKTQLTHALAAWPYPPSPQLRKITTSSLDISRALNDPTITSNKFRLVRRLRDEAKLAHYDPANFLRTDFWLLKTNIPLRSEMQDVDLFSFAELLLANNGRIGTFADVAADDTPTPIPSRGTHDKCHLPSTHDVVLRSLLLMLNGSENVKVHLAYQTLRRVLSTSKVGRLDFSGLPMEFQQQIRYLRANPVIVLRSHRSNLIAQLKNDSYMGEVTNFSVWIGRMASGISQVLSSLDPLFGQLSDALESDDEIARQLYPTLIHAALQNEGPKLADSSTRSALSSYFSRVLSNDSTCIRCLQTIIDVVLHLRYFQPPEPEPTKNKTPPLSNDQWLDVDFLLLSRRSLACGAYTTAVLFLELFAQYSSPKTQPTNVDEILFDIYKHIDEPDGFYGIKSSDLQQLLLKRFHHEGQWDKAFRFHGAEVEAGNKRALPGLLQTFTNMGFDNLAMNTLSNASTELEGELNPAGINYRLGWRTDRWDLPMPDEYSPDATLYAALRAVYRERNPEMIQAAVRDSLMDDIEHLRQLGDENLSEMKEVTRNVMSLDQIMKWCRNFINAGTVSMDLSAISGDLHFSDMELILSTRIALIRSARQKEERQQIGPLPSALLQELTSAEARCLVKLSVAARAAGLGQIALNSVTQAQTLQQLTTSDVTREYANVLWLEKEQKPAVQILQKLANSFVNGAALNSSELTHEAVVLTQLGWWTAEACLEKPADIQTNFFEPAIRRISDLEEPQAAQDHGTIFQRYAAFADSQYHAAINGMTTDILQRKQAADQKKSEMRDLKTKLTRCSQTSKDYKEFSLQMVKASKLEKQDRDLFNSASTTLTNFLEQALEMYSKTLQVCDTFDDSASLSLCSLWLANFEEDQLQYLIQRCLERVQTRKMAFLCHQISARLSTECSGDTPKENQSNLQNFLLRLVKEHPFHTLYPIYWMYDKRGLGRNRRSSGRQSSSIQAGRTTAAAEILEKLVQDSRVSTRIKDIMRVADACLEWSQFCVRPLGWAKPVGVIRRVPSHLTILKLKNIPVPVMTAHTPIDPSLRYDDLDCLVQYESHCTTAGGANIPKVHSCTGSKTSKYKQLFKGEGDDDLRQDAVMEQVFDLCNTLLRQDPETRKRNLRVRCYKVIPLAPTAGVLEFVDNTIVLSHWLQTAHVKYNPTDWSPSSVARAILNIRKDFPSFIEKPVINDKNPGHYNETNPPSLTVEECCVHHFKKIKENFHPVMRHWFYEKEKIPMSWFKARLNYTRSVVATSMVGYVLGLGDRHASNILLDKSTGEVVHIDLGIAFEQGKLLPIPEVIPFRLTADMVDGMGMSGTQGVFQRCSEEILRVLRDRSDVIMTVLEVFKHDPLHSWTVSEQKRHKVQDRAKRDHVIGYNPNQAPSSKVEESADRALGIVRRKLDRALSVEYTVNELISEATNVENLARLYSGWSPYL